MKKVASPVQEIFDLFQPVEGNNCVYYGRVGNGKTYAATADIIELLRRGEIVYANWPIKFDGYDERNSFWVSFVKLLFRKKYFFTFNKDNFHYFHPDDIDVAFLGKLVGVHLFIDEGQWIFNSQIRNPDPEKRKLILHGRHYCRSLNVVTQRPNNIMKDIRSQINFWYKCVKRFHFGRFIIFQRWTYEDMKDDLPDEEAPTGRPKTYIGNPEIFAAYQTHFMRGENAIVIPPKFEVYESTGWERVKHVFALLRPAWTLKRHAGMRQVKSVQGIKKIRVEDIRSSV